MTIPEPRCSQAIALALLSALGWLGGCSDNPGGLNSKLQPPPEDLVVSNPALIAGVTARAGSALARPAGATDSGGTVAYISLAPGTVPAGRSATVRRVGGTVRFPAPSRDATHMSVEFAPDAPLGAATDYLLVVTQQLRDLSGDLLAAPDTATFTTGQSTIGPPDSIRIAPDSQVVLVVG